MQWLPSLLDPLGETSRLHFTRAWTLLFFARLLVFVGPVIAVALLAAAGAKEPASYGPPVWFFPLFLVVTALMSTVLHIRRLSNAKRSPLWAVLVMVPVLVGFAGFIAGGMQGTAQYREALDQLHNPAPPAAMDRTDPTGDTSAVADETGEGERASREERLDPTKVSAREHAFRTALSMAQLAWAGPSFLVMLWSLLWVGRLPNGGGTIDGRLARMRAEQLTERF